MESLEEKIIRLKKEKDAVILAHYYVTGDVQEVADYVGDSFYLAKMATKVDQSTIVFAGVSFMGESAKILNPDKRVLLPDMNADCPMAHMASREAIQKVKEKYGDNVAVVCYINSTAELKTMSDVCVTSSNAMKIVKALTQEYIYFIPDEHLGRYIASKVPEKKFIFNNGFCVVHAGLDLKEIHEAKEKHPDAPLLVHPECPMRILEEADFIGSTSEIIDYATSNESQEFIIGTELGVIHELGKRNPDKKFYAAGRNLTCVNMKKVTLQKIANVLENGTNEVHINDEERLAANMPLNEMLRLAR